MRSTGRRPPKGSTYLEVQVAFATLGIVLAGFAPVIVAGQRILARAEARAKPAVNRYLAPPRDAWSRKLGVAATVDNDPGPFDLAPPGTPKNDVAIVAGSYSRSTADDTARLSATVKARPEPEGDP